MVQSDGQGRESPLKCPQCSRRLHLAVDTVECDDGHAYLVTDAAIAGGAQVLRLALWHAVQALQERASMSRWAAENAQRSKEPHPEELVASAKADDLMADVIRGLARRLDQSLGRPGR